MANTRFTKTGFNKTVSSFLGSLGTLQLMIQVQSPNKKVLTGIAASYFSQSSPIDSSLYYGNVIVCTGNLPLEEEGTILDLAVDFPNSAINGVGRILFKKIISGNEYIDFSTPIEVSEGDTLNVILGFGWKNGESLLAPGGCVATLSVNGFERNANNTTQFPFELR